jgi:hypothetical protein
MLIVSVNMTPTYDVELDRRIRQRIIDGHRFTADTIKKPLSPQSA